MSILSRLSATQKLGLLAFVLGALAVFGDPYGGGAVRVNTRELAAIVESEVDHVTAEELADWIIQGRTDYRIIDLRGTQDYASYHIPTAENVPITQLDDYPLYRNEKIVLYSGGGIHSAQAWFLLRAKGYAGVYILLGGLTAWTEDVLFPALPEAATPEDAAEVARLERISAFFGGSPRSGAAAPAQLEGMELPKVEMPAQVPVAPAKKKRRKEGC